MIKLVLRYRDLVTPPDDTINLHQEVINEHGYVYWGWWAKAGERCPSIFSDLQEELASEPQNIFLFDSGQNKLYEAKFTELEYNNRTNGMECPEKDKTPDYYRDRSFKAWFRFTEITELEQEDIKDNLNQFSYAANNYNLFKESEPFQDFFNKRVISTTELRYQDRTIWFFIPYLDGHEEHEILLYNSNTVNPSVFPKNYSKVYGSSILWLTDLHFSDCNNQHAFGDRFSSQPLQELVENQFKEKLHALIVSGDMTWRASSSEFVETSKFYTYLCSNTKLAFDKIGFCPGNHDLAFAGELTEEQKAALEKYQTIQRGDRASTLKLSNEEIGSLQAIEPCDVSKEQYELHFKQVVSASPDEYLSMGKKFLINQQRPVDICFLNSNRMKQYKYLFQGNGRIGEDQRHNAAKKMGWEIPKAYGAIRIVVLHHNLLPVQYNSTPYIGSSPGSYVYDSQATLKWCYEHDVDVILHGHTHQRSIIKVEDCSSELKKSIWIVGLGSTSAHHSHLIPGHLNQLANLDFSDEYITIQFYNIDNNIVREDGPPIILD